MCAVHLSPNVRARAAATRGERLRIAVIPERYGRVISPCASIRLHPFFESFKLCSRVEVRYVLPLEVAHFSPDVIVWHRASISHSNDVLSLRDLAKRNDTRLIYDLDDNLLDMDGHGEQERYQGVTDAVLASLHVADEIWCSTPNLVKRVSSETPAKVVLMPNALDPDLWMLPSEQPIGRREMGSHPLQLLYMGTRTHDRDFELLRNVMEQLERTQPGCFRLSIVGVRSDDSIRANWLQTLAPPSGVGASYPAFVHWFRSLRGFDAGLAPLMANSFNACKSPIKILDYAAIGLPTLASNVPAYTHSFTNGLDCVHVENTADAWASALADLLDQPGRMGFIGTNAKKSVDPARFVAALDARWRHVARCSDQL